MSANYDPRPHGAGCEWLIDAAGCCPRRLADAALLRSVLESVIADLGLHALGPGAWQRFPEPGGVTGIYLLSESHLTVHTWPEFGAAVFNLFCCRPRPDWPWGMKLRELLSAQQVEVRVIERGMPMEAQA
jgi:S-adenosylmethionine decarboxylase